MRTWAKRAGSALQRRIEFYIARWLYLRACDTCFAAMRERQMVQTMCGYENVRFSPLVLGLAVQQADDAAIALSRAADHYIKARSAYRGK